MTKAFVAGTSQLALRLPASAAADVAALADALETDNASEIVRRAVMSCRPADLARATRSGEASTRLHVRVTDSVRDALDVAKEASGTTLSDVVAHALRSFSETRAAALAARAARTGGPVRLAIDPDLLRPYAGWPSPA